MNANPHKRPANGVSSANFVTEVLESKQPVLVAFCAPWSHPCQVFESVLDEVATVCAGKVKVIKVNADDNPDLSLSYEIQSIPTLLYFVAGKLRARVVGTATRHAILAKLRKVSHDGVSSPSQPRPRPGK